MIVVIPKSFAGWAHDHQRQAQKIMSRIICGSLKDCIKYRDKRKLKGKPSDWKSLLGSWANINAATELKAIASNYSDIIADLERDGWIEVNRHYSNFPDKKYPQSYRLRSQWRSEPLTLHNVPQRLTKKILYRVVGDGGGELNAEYLAAERLLDSFSLPEDGADQLDSTCEESDWPDRQRYYVARFAGRMWWSKVDEYGRYHTPLTNLSKAIRQVIRCDGEGLACFDYANFQPALLTRQDLVAVPQAEYDNYFSLCSRGEIYDYIGEVLPQFESRDKAKVEFCTMLNETNDRMRRMELYKVFAVSFPHLSRAIEMIKEPDHKAMTRFLQHHETQLMFGGVVRELVATSNIKFFTVHDAICVPKSAAIYVRKIMERITNQYNIPTRVKRESSERVPVPTTTIPPSIPTNVGTNY